MIAIGADHCGFELKRIIEEHLKERGIEYKDYGCYDEGYVQYPIYGYKVAKAVSAGECDRGLLFCGTGMGMAIVANKLKGIRAAVCSDPYTARMSKMHNNANILTMGGRVVGAEVAKMIVDEWLNTEYEPRHKIRIDMITEVEETGSLKAAEEE